MPSLLLGFYCASAPPTLPPPPPQKRTPCENLNHVCFAGYAGLHKPAVVEHERTHRDRDRFSGGERPATAPERARRPSAERTMSLPASGRSADLVDAAAAAITAQMVDSGSRYDTGSGERVPCVPLPAHPAAAA